MESGTIPHCDQLKPIWHPSPNMGPRRDGAQPELVVIHFTAMHSARAALERLCDPVAEVSAHYLIAMDGTCWQMVDEAERAWHAGAGAWRGRGDVNSRSIGIELDNRGDHPFPEAQMSVLEHVLRGIMARWHIPPAGIIGHSDMAPGRKIDPGPHFDWQRLARQNLAAASGTGPPTVPDKATFLDCLAALGYPIDGPHDLLLQAFRQRHRPHGQGALSPQDMAAAQPSRIDADRASA